MKNSLPRQSNTLSWFRPFKSDTIHAQGWAATEKSLGSAVKQPTSAEVANTVGMRRSIVILKDMDANSVLKIEDIGFKRPATGLPPKQLKSILGKKINQNLLKDTILEAKHIQW